MANFHPPSCPDRDCRRLNAPTPRCVYPPLTPQHDLVGGVDYPHPNKKALNCPSRGGDFQIAQALEFIRQRAPQKHLAVAYLPVAHAHVQAFADAGDQKLNAPVLRLVAAQEKLELVIKTPMLLPETVALRPNSDRLHHSRVAKLPEYLTGVEEGGLLL